jgi:hypothetical protein
MQFRPQMNRVKLIFATFAWFEKKILEMCKKGKFTLVWVKQSIVVQA